MPKAALMNTSAQAYSKVVTAVSDLVEDAGNFLKLLCCAASEWVESSDVCFSFITFGAITFSMVCT